MRTQRAEREMGIDSSAEILALGVCPDYQSVSIDGTTIRTSYELFGYAINQLKKKNLRNLRIVIDIDNMQAMLFYHSLGGKFARYTMAGDQVYQIWFDLEMRDLISQFTLWGD